MELRLLEYFLAVVRKETISAAANDLHISQPTLSRQLKELEDHLCVKLFIRGNRKITLTAEGVLLRKRAEEILALRDKTEAEFLSIKEVVSGDIYIGAGETFAMRLVAKVMKDLQSEYPHIRFHIYSGNADDVSERLDRGLLDFGILIEPTNFLKYNSIPLPTCDNWGVLMRKDSLLAGKKTLVAQDLWNVPLITSRQTYVRDMIYKWLEKDYDELNIVATYNLLYNASLMVEENMGYALALDKLIHMDEQSNLCFRFLKPQLEAKLHIVWKKSQVFSQTSKLFLEKLQQTFENA